MPSLPEYMLRVIDARIDLKIKQLTKAQTSVVSGGGYSTSVSSGGVVAHGHDSAAHTGLTTDNHHAKLHGIEHLPAGTDPTGLEAVGVPYDPTTPGLTALDVQAAIDQVATITVSNVPPGAILTTLFYLDTTPVTGGLYAWDGIAYAQVAPAL